MKKITTFLLTFLLIATNVFAQTDSLYAGWTDSLDSTSVVSFYRNSINVGSLITNDKLCSSNYGQEPSHMFAKMPGIISLSDNGTEFGYGYYRIRGLDQTRINVTLDGIPWNEAEDFGAYFANSPDLMSSMHSIKVERGSSSMNNGISASAGNINLESIDLIKDTISTVSISGGSFNTYKLLATYNSGLLPNRFAFHIKFTKQYTDGYRDNSFNNSYAATIKTGYFFNNRSNIEFLSMNGQHSNGQGWIGNTIDELSTNPKSNGCTKEETDWWFQSVNKIQYKAWFSDKTFFSGSAYLQFQTGDYRMDLDNYMKRMIDSSFPITGAIYDYGLTHYLYGANAFVKYYASPRFSINSGVNYYRFSRRHFMNDNMKLVNVDPSEYYDNTGYKNDFDAFITASYSTRSNLKIVGNIQYRYVDFNYIDNLDSSFDFDEDTEWNFVNAGINIEQDIDSMNKLYIHSAITSREPTRTDMFGGNEYYCGSITGNIPERSLSTELGYSLVKSDISFNIDAYYMNFKNERILNGEYGLNGLPIHESAGKSFRTGIEASLDMKIYRYMGVLLNASRSFNKICSESFGGWTNHILTPDWIFDGDIYYKNEHLTIGVNCNYHSDMYVDLSNDSNYVVPEYFTLNIYSNYVFSNNIELFMKLNNITNRTNYCTGAIGVDGMMLYFPVAKFNMIGGVRYSF